MNNILIYGAGVSAQGAFKLLDKKGVSYTLFCDDMGEYPALESFDTILKSPGIPNSKPLILEAMQKGIEIIDEIELAYRYMPEQIKVVAITGTNGKTTTTMNMYNAFKALGYKVAYAGNIGFSYAELIATEEELDVIVLELSSFQLEHLDTFRANAAVLINLTPDHLDRYTSKEEYYGVKWNIFKNQQATDVAVVNIADQNILSSSELKALNVVTFAVSDEYKADLGYENHQLRIFDQKCSANIIEQFGRHNIENFLAIAGVLNHFGHTIKDILLAQEAFKCAEHRLEKFFSRGDVDFYNDSKATNVDSTIQAINSLNGLKDIYLVCGGKEKNLDCTDLIATIIEKNVVSVYLIGETANRLEKQLMEMGYPQEKTFNLGRLEVVLDVLKERLDFGKKSIVLLSPASSSYDQFKNFEDRGRVFKQLVQERFSGE